jgi:stalled ribosome alternative rescue factor ArfA
MKSVRQGIKEANREARKEQGFFDGRFRNRVEASKKSYSRKKKHKNLEY